jgi:hypothetical protein
MAANAQSVTNDAGEPCMIISERGFNAMTRDQQRILNASYKMVVSNVDMIEDVGGGSCRCLLVENWSTTKLPKRKNINVPNSESDQAESSSAVDNLSHSSMTSLEKRFTVKQYNHDNEFFFG